jgi:hypothetical protein
VAKQNLTYVDAAKFQSVIEKLGLPMQAQAGFVRVDGPAGRRIYVARTNRVARVDLAGFSMEGDGFMPFPGKNGSVEQQLAFEAKSEEEILTNFERALKHMQTLPPIEAKKKSMTSAGPKVKPVGWKVPTKEERGALIRKVAAEKGAKVSTKTEAELR